MPESGDSMRSRDPPTEIAGAQPSAPGLQGLGGYRPEIDGLRAVAVTGVILFHTGLDVVAGGYVGVDIFFVISGYLIASIIERDMGAGQFTFLAFYDRRVRRIFPALFVVLVVTAIAAWSLLPPRELLALSDSLAATAGFVSNIYFWQNAGYFAGDVEKLPLIQMWSLSVEEQYYSVFPFIWIILRRHRACFLNSVLIVFVLLSFVGCIFYTRDHRTAGFFLTPARAWELLTGALVALNQSALRRPLAGRRWLGLILELLGAVAIAGPIFLYDRRTVFPGVAAVAPVVGTALILLVSTRASAVGRVLASKPLVGMGLISYSAYLWHQPLFALARAVGLTEQGPIAYVFLIGLTAALAVLSWRFVEKPLRRPRVGTRAQVFGVFAALSLLLIGLGGLGHFSHGAPGRFDRATFALEATAAASPLRRACHTSGVSFMPPERACRYFAGPAHWAVLGDSHGIEIAYAIAERLRPARQGVLHLTFSSCPPALTFQSSTPGCDAWIRRSVAYLTRSPQITDIVVVFYDSAYLFGDQARAYPRQPNASPTFLTTLAPSRARAAYLASFTELVRRLSAAGKRVYLVRPIPDLPTSVEHYIFTTALPGLRGSPTGESVNYYLDRNRLILSEMDSLKSLPNVTLLDPSKVVCGSRQCASIIGRASMYFDDNHLSLEGARRFVQAEQVDGALTLGDASH